MSPSLCEEIHEVALLQQFDYLVSQCYTFVCVVVMIIVEVTKLLLIRPSNSVSKILQYLDRLSRRGAEVIFGMPFLEGIDPRVGWPMGSLCLCIWMQP